MTIQTELYTTSRLQLPATGRHILAHQRTDELVVYQAYKPTIAQYAVENQCLGGNEFSYARMSWIKPNFLWMMYRCGWGTKENQERILALWLSRAAFEEILAQAAFSTFAASGCATHEEWKQELATKRVRLQWDPDHGPHGNKLDRRAIQLGLKGEVLEKFGRQQVTRIDDITPFVQQQKTRIATRQLESLRVPIERIYTVADPALATRIQVEPF